jgi:hypothetical protein
VINVNVFQDMTPFRLIDHYRNFGGALKKRKLFSTEVYCEIFEIIAAGTLKITVFCGIETDSMRPQKS